MIDENGVSKFIPKSVNEWYAFHSGEELGISFGAAAMVWEAATRAAKSRELPPKCSCGKEAIAVLCRECSDAWTEACK